MLSRLLVGMMLCFGVLAVPKMASADPYVALGDSVTAWGSPSYAKLLYDASFGPDLGADEYKNLAQPGATSGTIRSGGQLTTAVQHINDVSDTKVVTVGAGGNDALVGTCDSNFHLPACPFRENFRHILDQLKAALDSDPGDELFIVLAYYNPGTGSALEADYARKLLGSNGVVGYCDAGLDLGLNDVIYQEAARLRLPVADAYPPFQAGGPSLISADQIHPTQLGYQLIADQFLEPIQTPVLDCEDPPPGCATDPALCPPPTGPTGVAGFNKVTVSGPAKVKRNKIATYSVKISNSGNAAATGVRLKVSGRGLSFNTSVGVIQGGSTRTVKVKVKPKRPGKIKATFKVTSENAGGKSVKKTIKVKK